MDTIRTLVYGKPHFTPAKNVGCTAGRLRTISLSKQEVMDKRLLQFGMVFDLYVDSAILEELRQKATCRCLVSFQWYESGARKAVARKYIPHKPCTEDIKNV